MPQTDATAMLAEVRPAPIPRAGLLTFSLKPAQCSAPPDDEGDAQPMHDRGAHAAHFQQRKEHQRQWHAFDEIGVASHAAQQLVIAAVANRDFFRAR